MQHVAREGFSEGKLGPDGAQIGIIWDRGDGAGEASLKREGTAKHTPLQGTANALVLQGCGWRGM